MDLHTLISTGLDGKLKCFLCKNYLSFFPISICSNGQSICGRCTIPEGSTSYHEEALETLCHLLTFPCRYRTHGCSEELYPDYIPQHEENCQFRVVTCIMNNASPCNWSGSLPTLLPHCQNQHSDAFLKNGDFEIDLSRSDEHDHLIEYDSRMILFTRKFDAETKELRCAVDDPYQNSGERRCWQIRVQAPKTTLLRDFESSNMEKIFTTLRLHCIADKCEQLLLCSISVEKITTKMECEAQLEDNSEVYSLFKCICCGNAITPPVYRCPLHLYIKCSTCICKPCPCLLSRCSQLTEDDTLSHIFRLFIKHPCKYQKNGCTYVSVLKQIKIHETSCEYKSEKCILHKSENCSWEGFVKDMQTHLTRDHPNLNLNSEYEITPKDTVMETKCIRTCGHLFRLVYLIQGSRYVWAVQTLCGAKETFKYQIDVVDATNSGQRLSMRRVCARRTEEGDILKDSSMYCYIETDQVCSLAESKKEGSVLKFKLSIFK